MANGFEFDASEWQAAFDRLKGSFKESLARRMLVSGGVVLRDQAKANARNKGPWNYNPTSRGSQKGGTLSDAIYLAFDDKKSNGVQFTYKISWNAKLAWWGKLVEFPHFMRYAFFRDKDGVWHTIKRVKLEHPKLVPARPFLAPAYDVRLADTKSAMIERGREELPKLLQEMVRV